MKKKKLYFLNLLVLKKGVANQRYSFFFKSFFFNSQLDPHKRLFFNLNTLKRSNIFYKSRIKLLCLFTGIKRVPNKKYMVSRFFLNKYSDNLNLGLFLKK